MDATSYMPGLHHLPQHDYAQHHYMHNPRPATAGAVQAHEHHNLYPAANTQMACDIKPRLNREQTDMLESEYQRQNKPNTQTKRGFAETLGVSLDKVNNWFQNRRAKSKQEVRKAADAQSYLVVQQQHQHQQEQQPQPEQPVQQTVSNHVDYNPHVNLSPTFTPEDYQYLMQHCTSDEQADTQYVLHQPDQDFGTSGSFQPAAQSVSPDGNYPPFALQHQASAPELYQSQEDFNRRTMTQEAFDAIAVSGLPAASTYETYQNGFDNLPADIHNNNNNNDDGNFQEQTQVLSYAPEIPPAMSGYSSSVPSSITDSKFPSTLSLTELRTTSADSSEWSTSRNSSTVAFAQYEGQLLGTSPQWQPDMSVPVDYEALNQEFQQNAHLQSHPQQMRHAPSVWSSPDALTGPDLQVQFPGSNAEGSVSPEQQDMRFKSPAPPSNIAARRQRAPRPAALGLASLRSVSYNEARQQLSPSQPVPPLTAPGHSLRRIRSSNVVTGSGSGRVQKSLPGSAQRSPLAWNFTEALNSPKALRHASSMTHSNGSFAPPTPRSPYEFAAGDPQLSRPTMSQRPSVSSQASRQPSIAESEMESSASTYMPPGSATAPKFSSPPHTPMYLQTQFIQQRLGSTAITENTPPKSAPASQTTFGIGVFMPPSAQPQFHAGLQQPVGAPSMPGQQNVHAGAHSYEPGFLAYDPSAAQIPVEYAPMYAKTMVQPTGPNMMGYPPQMQSMPQTLGESQPKVALASPTGQFSQFPASPPSAQGKAGQPPAELEFLAYSPTDDMKRPVTLRRPTDNEPKNYTFANHTSEHFERVKKPNLSKIIPSPESLS